jgi:hypothetical protein
MDSDGMTKTQPRTHTLILTVMFFTMATLGTFQEPFRILAYIGIFGAGIMLGTTIQGIYPDLFREKVKDV